MRRNSFTAIRKNLHSIDISSTYHLPTSSYQRSLWTPPKWIMDRPKGINQIKIANSWVLSTRINKNVAYLLLSLKSHLLITQFKKEIWKFQIVTFEFIWLFFGKSSFVSSEGSFKLQPQFIMDFARKCAAKPKVI